MKYLCCLIFMSVAMHMKNFRNVEMAQQLVKRKPDCTSSRKGYGEEEHHGSCVRLFQIGKVGKTYWIQGPRSLVSMECAQSAETSGMVRAVGTGWLAQEH